MRRVSIALPGDPAQSSSRTRHALARLGTATADTSPFENNLFLSPTGTTQFPRLRNKRGSRDCVVDCVRRSRAKPPLCRTNADFGQAWRMDPQLAN